MARRMHHAEERSSALGGRDSLRSEQDSDADEEGYAADLRTSTDSALNDHDVLDEEQEQQQLLTGSRRQRDAPEQGAHLASRRAYSPRPHRQSKGRKHGKREVMHEMEEGGPASRGSSSDSSSEYDREKIANVFASNKSKQKRSWLAFTIIYGFVLVIFLAIAYGAYRASQGRKHASADTKWLSNGTSLFAPTTIVVSLDGYRADFLNRGLSPTLNKFIKEGVSPKYMTPSFPSLTFPNHYTLFTGLHPESHGIVANSFWDDEFQEEFGYTDREHSMQPKWWYPHPLWETAELQGVPTAIHMWPGSEAHIGQAEPLHVDKYNGSELLANKVDRVLGWLDKPGPKDSGYAPSDARPQLIAAYVPDVDSDGHKFGPNSTEIRATIQNTDDMLKSLFEGLEARNLTDVVNVVVVSDHGMATTSSERLLQFEDLVDPDLIEHIDGWPHYGLRPKNPDDIGKIYARLRDAQGKTDGFEAYLKEGMPERFHFQHHHRIAPVWLIAKTGWAIVTKDEYDVAAGHGPDGDAVYHPRGIHGYDNEHPLMRAIFVARGPAFPHAPGSRVPPFQNTEVYNILCDSLGVEPHASNGTLRLPLLPVGLHGDETDEVAHVDVDQVSSSAAAAVAMPTSPATADEASDGADKPADEAGDEADGPVADDEDKKSRPGFWKYWEWFKSKLDKTLGWVKDKFHSATGKGKDGEKNQ